MTGTRATLVSLAIAATLVGCSHPHGDQASVASPVVSTEASLSTLVQKDKRLHEIFASPAPGDGWEIDGDSWTSSGLRGAADKRWNDVGVRIPRSSAGAFELGVSVFPAARLTFRARDAADVAGEPHDGHVTYPSAFGPSVDLVAGATHSTGELALHLRDASAPGLFSWDVVLGSGIARVRKAASGGLTFDDARGRTVLRMPAAYAVDAAGKLRDAEIDWNEASHRLDIHLDTQGLTFPVLLDPAVETSSWNVLSLPTARDGQAMTYDTARGRTVLFGGYDTGSFGDTWVWNGTAWNAALATGPSPRSAHMMAFDAERGNVVMFGGEPDGSGELDDTWTYNGTSWAQATPANSPPGRHYGAMTFDAKNKNVVLFGGLAGTADLSDTWIWDGSNWTQAAPAASPHARSRHALAYDAASTNVVLFSGVDDTSTMNRDQWTRFDDTWTWDGTNWTQATPATSPSGREYVTLAYDSNTSAVLLFGGVDATKGAMNDTWSWNGTTWTQLAAAQSPPARYWPTIAHDIRGRTLLFGGWIGGHNLNDTWVWTGSTWEVYGVEPNYRAAAMSAYDAARGQVVLFGGYVGANTAANDTWTYDGISWTQQSPASQPSARIDASMTYDATNNVTVLFGGDDPTGGRTTPLGDTWTWNGSNWTAKSPTNAPAARYGGSIDYDAVRKNVVLFGGFTTADQSDTWTWDGTNWTSVVTATSPPASTGNGMAFDAAHGVSIFLAIGSTFGGVSETWTFNGSAWSEVTPASAPPPRTWNTMGYDSARQRVVTFGGVSGTEYLTDTWSWNGTTWTNESPTSYPTGSAYGAMAYDPVHGKFVYFGGEDATYLYGDTWFYSTVGGGCTDGSQCDSGFCTDGVCCAVPSCGTCEACDLAAPGTCQPVESAPDLDSCPGSCNAAAACKNGLGQMCAVASDCGSGFCVDGVCCNLACNGLCQACTAANKASGADGTCGDAALGTDAHSDCPDEGAELCGRDGTCNGSGACHLYNPGTSCGSSGCSGDNAIGMICDGLGSCVQSNTAGQDCGAFACDVAAGGCVTTCTDDDQCSAGFYCKVATGQCMMRSALGAACSDSDSCPAGAACADGVCCSSACSGQCESCVEPGTVGTCVLATGAPRGSRPMCATGGGADICAAKICDGLTPTSCTGFVGPSSTCRSASCVDSVATLAASCTGSGVCPSAIAVTCAPFGCAGAACATSCVTDDDCDLRFRCDSETHGCIARQGSSCDGDHTVSSQAGVRTDCTPYKCQGSSCRSSCDSIEACTDGNICSAAGTCVPPVAPDTASACSSATTLGSVGTTSSAPAVLFGLLAMLRARARKRRSRAAEERR